MRLSEIEEVKLRERSALVRLIGIFGFLFAGFSLFQISYPSAIATAAKSIIQKFRSQPIRALIRKYLLKFFSNAPIFWLINGLALLTAFVVNLIIQDTRVLVGIQSIKATLNKILQNIRRLENVSRSDIRKLTSWRWEVIPWQSNTVDTKPLRASDNNNAGFETSTTDGTVEL
ncbi:hypothetical protein TWF730_006543 [Orbilia blumenaviensis]|uniref:ATP synthase protein MI25 n=1 Tax=Orbilia blumenaviensis TaxID=1796055 RepID=A0AAV9VGY2_9PEZI